MRNSCACGWGSARGASVSSRSAPSPPALPPTDRALLLGAVRPAGTSISHQASARPGPDERRGADRLCDEAERCDELQRCRHVPHVTHIGAKRRFVKASSDDPGEAVPECPHAAAPAELEVEGLGIPHTRREVELESVDVSSAKHFVWTLRRRAELDRPAAASRFERPHVQRATVGLNVLDDLRCRHQLHQPRIAIDRSPPLGERHRCRVDRAAADEWIRANVEPVGAIETAHELPWATVLRVPVAEGVVWFKACAPAQAFEPRLSAELLARWPDRVAEVLGHDEERAWVLPAIANVYVRDERLRVLDWGDASISHPFASLVVTFRSSRRSPSWIPATRGSTGCATRIWSRGAAVSSTRTRLRAVSERSRTRSAGRGNETTCRRRHAPTSTRDSPLCCVVHSLRPTTRATGRTPVTRQ